MPAAKSPQLPSGTKRQTMKKAHLILLPALALGLTALPATGQEQTDTTETIYITTEGDTTAAQSSGITFRRVGVFSNSNRGNAYNCDNSYGRTPKRWRWRDGHWAGVGIYYNGLFRNIGDMNLPSDASFMQQTPKSIGVSINFVDFTLVSNRSFGLITGLGLEVNNFRFDRNVGLTQNADGYIVADYSYDQAGVNLSKSKLTTTYLNIPILAEFQFGRHKSGQRKPGFVNFGVIAGIRLEGHTKVKSKDFTGGGTVKQHGGLNLRNFHYGAEFNIGYKYIALSARYYPQSIFIEDGGPKVQQGNIGLLFTF